jgi:hypothetical protein
LRSISNLRLFFLVLTVLVVVVGGILPVDLFEVKYEKLD